MKNNFVENNSILFKAFGAIITLVTLLVIYATHREVPIMMDDNWYSTMLFSDQPIRNVADIFSAQYWHYHNWGGRSVTHSILQLTLLLNERVMEVLNVVVTVVLGMQVCKVAKVKDLFLFAMSLGMLYAFNADWLLSMHWQSGAANYLYITVVILLFLYCYLRELDGESGKLPGAILWMAPLGVLAGWSNENMGPAIWVLVTIVIILLKKRGRKLAAWMYLGNLGCMVGSVLVILAPGNFVRVEEAVKGEYGTLWTMFLRCYAECKASFEYLYLAVILTGALMLLAKALGCTIGERNILLLIGALLSWGAMILSPHYPARATFGTMVLLTCVCLSMVGKILEKRKDLKAYLSIGLLLVWLRGMFFLGEYLAISWGWIK